MRSAQAAGCTLAHIRLHLETHPLIDRVGFEIGQVGLEAENTELQALVKEWRMWYAQCASAPKTS